jgi:hypothetical protein
MKDLGVMESYRLKSQVVISTTEVADSVSNTYHELQCQPPQACEGQASTMRPAELQVPRRTILPYTHFCLPTQCTLARDTYSHSPFLSYRLTSLISFSLHF